MNMHAARLEYLRAASADVLRRHWGALAAASAMALIVASPLIAFPLYAGDAYNGINILHFGNDQHYYLTRGKEALEGHSLGQPFLAEGKEAQDPTFSYADMVVLAPASILGLSERVDIVSYYNVLNTLAIFVLVLMIYALALRLSGDRVLALASALFVVGGYAIIEAKTVFYGNFDVYGRSLFPFASSIPMFGFLIALHDALLARSRRALLLAGALAGALCYVYFFAWTFAFALLAALGFIYLLSRDWTSLKSVCIAGGIGALIGSYNIAQLLLFHASPIGAQLAFFYASVQSHLPLMSKIGLGTTLLTLLVAWRKGWTREMPFVLGIILAGWIALNQQVITGRLIQYGHYYWYFIVPFSVVIGAYLFGKALPHRFRRMFAYGLIALAFVNVSGQQFRAFFGDTLQFRLREQTYAPILAALKNEPKGAVLAGAGGESYTFLITIYTSHDLYWIPAAEIHVFPADRLLEALEVHLFLNREARADPVAYLESKLSERPRNNEYLYLYEELEGLRSGLDYYAYQRALAAGETSFGGLRERLLRDVETRYKAEFSERRISALLKERGVRYVLWDAEFYPEWDLSPLGRLTALARSGPLTLYRLED